MRPTTPGAADPEVLALCHALVPGADPVRLEVAPVSHAEPLDCFATVRRQVRNLGGEPVYGWQLWEWPGFFLEAEFHAVWRNRAGELRDITPKAEPVSHILFVPDSVRVFSGARVPNVRRALSDDPRVRELLRLFDEEWQLLYHGRRASQRDVSLGPAEALALATIAALKYRLATELGLMLATGQLA